MTEKNSHNNLSDAPGERTGLFQKTLRGLRITTSFTALKTVIDIICQLALVRILMPESFGLMAFLLSTAGFFVCLSDWGGGRYIIQEKKLSRERLNTVFTTEFIVSVLLALAWLCGSASLLRILGKAHLIPYAWLFTFWIVLERLQLPRFILERELKFGKTNIATFTGVACGAIFSVILAMRGCGVYSLILGLLVRSAVTATILWHYAPMKPRFQFSSRLAGPYLKFGVPLTLTSLFTFYYWNIDYIIVGKILNETQLGYYYNAFKFAHYILQLQVLVSTVVYPAFSRSKDNAQLKRGFSLATKYSGAVAFLPCIAVICLGEGLVRYGMGEKWLPALRPLQIFTCLAAFRMITMHWYDVYVSRGKTGAMPFLGLSNALGVSAAAYLGARYGGTLIWVASGVALVNALVIFYAVNVLLRRIIKVSYFRILSRPVAVASVTLTLTYLAGRFIHLPWGRADLGLKLVLMTLIYGSLFLWLDRNDLKSLLQRFRQG